MADNFALGSLKLVLSGAAALLSFLCGSILSTLLIRWARGRSLESEYALPLLVEAGLLVLFGVEGHTFTGGHVLGTVMLLCFTMGLQNAMITKLSDSVIRTTHMTGIVTDIGIALGRIAFARSTGNQEPMESELADLRLLSSLVALFFTGGVVGAIGFKHVGFLFTLPLSAVLLLLAIMPVLDDVRRRGLTTA